jgi:hypothetical protein
MAGREREDGACLSLRPTIADCGPVHVFCTCQRPESMGLGFEASAFLYRTQPVCLQDDMSNL